MRKSTFFVIFAAIAMGICSCADSQFDEQAEAASVKTTATFNKGAKTSKVDKALEGKGPDKNAKQNVMPIAQSVTGPWKPFPIRHPTEE